MIGIFPEPRDLAAESRSRIRQAAEEVDAAAQRIRWLQAEMPWSEQRHQELVQRYPDFRQNRGRRVSAATLAVIAALGTFLFDFMFLAPLGDFLMNWAGVPGWLRVPVRAVSALVWTLTGYAIGAKLGVLLRARQPNAWVHAVPAMAYVLAMPTIAFFVGQPVFEGTARLMLLPLSLLLSSMPIAFGYFAAEAVEYLVFLGRVCALERRKRAVSREIQLRGQELLRHAQRLAAAVDEHRRKFGEVVQPMISELAQRLIAEFSRGSITVTVAQPEAGQPAGAMVLPRHGANVDASRTEPQLNPGSTPQPANDGDGAAAPADGCGRETRMDNLVEYLRRQLENRAAAEDSELNSPSEFTTRLP